MQLYAINATKCHDWKPWQQFYSFHICVQKTSGHILQAACNCKAGAAGLCAHIGALLYTLVKLKKHALVMNADGTAHGLCKGSQVQSECAILVCIKLTRESN